MPLSSATQNSAPRSEDARLPWYAGCGASGRRRVRGKDCVHLSRLSDFIALLNSFLPERADTGRMERSSP
jgi:hypothetical protein